MISTWKTPKPFTRGLGVFLFTNPLQCVVLFTAAIKNFCRMYTYGLSYGAAFRHGAGHYFVCHIAIPPQMDMVATAGINCPPPKLSAVARYASLYAWCCVLVCIDFLVEYVI